MFSYPTTTYNNDLALVAAALNAAAGKHEENNGMNLESAYIELGFAEENIDLYSYRGHPRNKDVKGIDTTDNEFAFSIAHQTMNIAGEQTNVIVIVLRGTELEMEGLGDFFTSANSDFYGEYKVHDYFLRYMEDVWAGLKHYSSHHTDSKGKPILGKRGAAKTKILIAGHSLGGGAVANLLAAKMTLIQKHGYAEWEEMGWQEIPQAQDIYAYTFGALNAFDRRYEKAEEDFGYIHNIFIYL